MIVTRVYCIFDQLHMFKESAEKVQEENGSHKDTVKTGYYVVSEGDYMYMRNGNTIPCETMLYDTFSDAWADFIDNH